MLKFGLRLVALVCLIGLFGLPAHAQDNALTNGGFEEGSFGQYLGRRGGEFPIYLPNGWNYWIAPSNGERYNRADKTTIQPHPGPGPSPQEGNRAVNIDCGYFTCTAALYQQIGGLTAGATVSASAYSQVKACNLGGGTSCGSAIESGSQTRIGIDPAGGTDPTNPAIVWSAWTLPHDQWLQQRVETQATASTVTIFLYSTQSSFADLNKTYWDAATFSGPGAGSAAPGAVVATAAPTAPPSVPFVVPQNAQDDGSIVHTVQSGDTMDSIAFAYGVPRATIMELNNIADPRIISVGQRLIISTPEPGADDREGAEGANVSAQDVTEDAGDAPEPTAQPDTESEPTVEAEDTIEGAVVVEGGETPATEEAQQPTPEPQPTQPLPTAPVVVAQAGGNPASTLAQVCVELFDDANQNRIQESGEALLAGGTITLALGGQNVGTYETDGASEPHCFEELAPGDYTLLAAAPDGYGLTTPDQLRLQANPGPAINVNFGAAQGVQPVLPPPADAGDVVNEVIQEETAPQTLTDQLAANAGLIVFGLAALVLIGGAGVTLLMRRR